MDSEDPAVQRAIGEVNKARARSRRFIERTRWQEAVFNQMTFGEKVIILALVVSNIAAWAWIAHHDAASVRALEAQGDNRWHETR